MRRVAPEEENVRAALAWSADDDPGLGLRLAIRMRRYWSYHGRYGQGRRWLDEMISRNPERTPARALALSLAAADAVNKGDYERSAPLCGECLSIWLELREEAHTIAPLILSGRIASDRGDHALARSLLERAAALARQHNSTLVADALLCLGNDAWIVGDYSRSRQLLADALDLFRRIGSQEGIGFTQSNLGGLACSEGAYALARAHLAESIDAHRAADFEAIAGVQQNRLGYVSLREGDPSRARAEFAECLRLAVPFGWRTTMSVCLAYLALLAIREREAERAVRLVGAAEAVNPYMRHLLPPDQLAILDACLAEARQALGDAEFGRAWAEGQAMTSEQAVEYALNDA
jgi:non-specific serine/threonine protein kinase